MILREVESKPSNRKRCLPNSKIERPKGQTEIKRDIIMIIIEVKKNDKAIVEDLMQQRDSVRVVEPFGLDGEAIVQLVVEITRITAPLIAGIIIANITTNKITVKEKGVNITMSLSKKNKTELITRLFATQKTDGERENNESVD